MKFPLTVSSFAQWAEKNRTKRFDSEGSRANSCPLATCLKVKKLATEDVLVGADNFSLTEPDDYHDLPKWAMRFVHDFDDEQTDSFTGGQILRIIKKANLCKIEKSEKVRP